MVSGQHRIGMNTGKPQESPRRLPYSAWWPLVMGALAGLALRLIFSAPAGGAYSAMLNSFVVGSPALVGAVTVYLAERQERRSWRYYFFAPFVANLLYVIGSLLILVEGWICAIVILPMFGLIGGCAGLLMGVVCRVSNWPRGAVASSFAILPLFFGAIEHRVRLPDLERTLVRDIHVAAPPARVWRELIDVQGIEPAEVEQAWMYRIGVPLPLAALADQSDGAHRRHVSMGKGVRFDQVATIWRENEVVSWAYEFAEDSFPPGALDDHVRIGGHYFDLGETRYELRPVDGGSVLTMRMSYRVSTGFNWYAAPVADFLVGDFAARILQFYARRAQQAGAGFSE
jgi:hypothetical protein